MAARTFTGAEAAAAWLVTSAVPGASLEEETRAFAEHLAGLGPLALRGAKRAIALVAEHLGSARRHLPEEAAEVDRLVAQAYASEDLAEGLAALAAKRPPNFRGH